MTVFTFRKKHVEAIVSINFNINDILGQDCVFEGCDKSYNIKIQHVNVLLSNALVNIVPNNARHSEQLMI